MTVTDTTDRHYGEHGTVTGIYTGTSGKRFAYVRLDRTSDVLPYQESELDLGEVLPQ